MQQNPWAGPQVGGGRVLDWHALDQLHRFDVWTSYKRVLSPALEGLEAHDVGVGSLSRIVSELHRPVLWERWRIAQVALWVAACGMAAVGMAVLLEVVAPAVRGEATPNAFAGMLSPTASITYLLAAVGFPLFFGTVTLGARALSPPERRDPKVQRTWKALHDLRATDQLIAVPRGWILSAPTAQWATQVSASITPLRHQLSAWRAAHPDGKTDELLDAIRGLVNALNECEGTFADHVEHARERAGTAIPLDVDWTALRAAYERVERVRHGMDHYDRLLKALPAPR